MASLIKNQIIKHLSKFVKNLSQDKINLSTFKGEGELSDIELDETVLMDLMDLPTWVVLTKAVCNKVTIKIPWTKLKTHPACLYLDQVEVEMKITDELRHPCEFIPLHSSGGKYGFSDKVIDGLYVIVNAVNINFHSKAFHASAQISRFRIRSTNPSWQTADLRFTRIKDNNRGEILIFKEADWMTLRIEVDAIKKNPNRPTTAIRLITNQGKVRFTIKKRLSDCMMVTSKVQLLLEDLLWVLTDSQLKAVLEYCHYLGGLHKQSENQVKTDTNIQSQAKTLAQGNKNQSSQSQQQNLSADAQAISKFFEKHDVVETSYHIVMNRVDLHLCDEQNRPESEAGFKRRTEGGAMQITLQKFSMDVYPYHIANTSRAHWDRFDEAMSARDSWVEHLMVHFRHQVNCAREQGRRFKTRPKKPSTDDPSQQPLKGQSKDVRGPQFKGQTSSKPQVKQARLLENTVVIRLEDFTLFSVSTAQSSHKAPSKKFITSDKKALFLPPEMSSVHIEYTSYYFPEGLDFPLPQSNVFAKLNPVHLTLDFTTILWLYQFANNMATGMKDDSGPPMEFEHRDIRIDALMPKITLPAENEITNQPDRPKSLQLLSSQLTISNSRIATNSSKSDLGTTLQKLYSGKMFNETEVFPNEPEDVQPLPKMLWDHAYTTEHRELLGSGQAKEVVKKVHQNGVVPSMKQKAEVGESDDHKSQKGAQDKQSDVDLKDRQGNKVTDSSDTPQGPPLHAKSFSTFASEDVWCINFEQVWAEFLGTESAKGRPVSLVEATPLMIWACFPTNSREYTKSMSNKKIPKEDRPRDDATSKHSKPQAIHYLDRKHRRKLLQDYYKSESSTESIDSSPSGTTPDWVSRSMSDSVYVRSHTEKFSDSRDYYSDSKTSSPPPPRQIVQSLSIDSTDSSPTVDDSVFSSASSITDKQEAVSEETSDAEAKVPDRCIVLHSDSKVRIMLNHYQLLFLLRLVDSFSSLIAALEEDYVMFFERPSPIKSMVIDLRLHYAELTLLMAPIPKPEEELDEKESTDQEKKGMQLLSIDTQNAGVQSDSIASQDSGLGTPTTETKTDGNAKVSAESASDDTGNKNAGESSSGDDTKVKLELENESSTASVESAEEAALLDPSTQTEEAGRGLAIPASQGVQYKANANELRFGSLQKPPEGDTLVVPGTPPLRGDTSPLFIPSTPQPKPESNPFQILANKSAGFMKKTFKSSSFTDLINSASSQTSLDDASSVDSGSQWETMSVGSDVSDQYLLLNSEAFKGSHGGAGTYVSGDGESEGSFSNESVGAIPLTIVTEDRTTSRSSTPSVVSSAGYVERKPQIASVVDLNLQDLQLNLQFDGENTAIKLVIGNFEADEKGNHEVEWFLSKRIAEGSSKCKVPSEDPPTIEDPVLAVRLTLGNYAEKYCPGVGDRGHLGVEVQGMDTQILMSTITNVLSLIEEETIGDYMPMDIRISNANVKMESDTIPAYPLTRPDCDEPIGLYLESAVVKRTLDGVYHLNSTDQKNDTTEPDGASCGTLSVQESYRLQQQNKKLKEQLDVTRSALTNIEKERSLLIASLAHMQDELISSDREGTELKNLLEKMNVAIPKR
ncbi:bridge-like lipid transfer protein family member 3B [Glandiceps talaboti]